MDLMCTLWFWISMDSIPVCTKMISSWVRKVLDIAKANVFPGTHQAAKASAVIAAIVSWRPSCRQATGPEFLPLPDTFFDIHHYYRLAAGFCTAHCPVSQ